MRISKPSIGSEDKVSRWCRIIGLAIPLGVFPALVADPGLPLPRIPICGDQDGSESPLVFKCSEFAHSPDVQTYQVPGTSPIVLRFDFVFREATFNNELLYMTVDAPNGSIEGIEPGQPGYLAKAWTRAQVVFPSGSTAHTADFERDFLGGQILAFFIVQDSTFAKLLQSNPDNLGNKSPKAFFSLDVLNPDGKDHFVGFENTVAETPYSQFGFEDITGGGDKDYDDVVYNILPPLAPLTGQVLLTPDAAALTVLDTHTLEATVTNLDGDPLDDVAVTLTASGANPHTEVLRTAPDGTVSFSYVGLNEGLDTILAEALIDGIPTPSNVVLAQWSNIKLRFPLRGKTPGADEGLDPDTATINAVFDHSMTNLLGGWSVYRPCDKVVQAFSGEVGDDVRRCFGQPPCGCGYTQESGEPFAFADHYSGGRFLYYDNHPGIDYRAQMETEVYASVSGTVHYPKNIVGIRYGNRAYDTFHVLALIPDDYPEYTVYYLHLDTHPATGVSVLVEDSTPGCSATVELPLKEGAHIEAGCLLALSGQAGVEGAPHLHFEVQRRVPANRLPPASHVPSILCLDDPSWACVPVDPYGWEGPETDCAGSTGDSYECLTGLKGLVLWAD